MRPFVTVRTCQRAVPAWSGAVTVTAIRRQTTCRRAGTFLAVSSRRQLQPSRPRPTTLVPVAARVSVCSDAPDLSGQSEPLDGLTGPPIPPSDAYGRAEYASGR